MYSAEAVNKNHSLYPFLSFASFFAIVHLRWMYLIGRLKLQRGSRHVASLAFTASTALATLALAVALLRVASGNLHGDRRVGSDVAHVPDLFSAATTPPRSLALCALAEADATTAASGTPLEERACRRPLAGSIMRNTLLCCCVRYPPMASLHIWPLSWPSCCATRTSKLFPKHSS